MRHALPNQWAGRTTLFNSLKGPIFCFPTLMRSSYEIFGCLGSWVEIKLVRSISFSLTNWVSSEAYLTLFPLQMEGLHTFKGMIGYHMKVNWEEQFEFIHHNVCTYDMNEGKLEYVKFGKVGLNNHVSLSHNIILQRAHQWSCSHMKKHLGVILPNILFYMCKNGHFYPNPTWFIPMRSTRMDVRKATSIWKIMMTPYDNRDGRYPNVFFDTISGVSNMRYFKSQQVAHERRDEEREFNRVLRDNCVWLRLWGCGSRKGVVVGGHCTRCWGGFILWCSWCGRNSPRSRSLSMVQPMQAHQCR